MADNVGNDISVPRVKFMQTVTKTQWLKLKGLAKPYDATVQEYLRIFVIGPHLQHIKVPKSGKSLKKMESAKRGWIKRRKNKTHQDDAQSVIPRGATKVLGLNPNLPPVPPRLSQMEH